MELPLDKVGHILMSLGALDDLAEIIDNKKGVSWETVPERIRKCTQKIYKSVYGENYPLPEVTHEECLKIIDMR